MTNKRKILFANQVHYMNTGFGTYGKEVLTRLHNSGKFEIAEFAFDATVKDKELNNCPWRVYPCAVDAKDPRYKEYKSQPTNARGGWRFDRVLLDFQPDITFTIEDPWNIKLLAETPLRPYFHFVACPTYDSKPYRQEWIEMLENIDACFTYSKFGLDNLKEQSSNINLIKPLWSGVDLDEFKPVNKKELKQKLGIDPSAFIVGMTARNQVRKLFPDLFKAFRMFLEKCEASGNKELADKTYLYIHTSYPDRGWDIPDLLLEHKIAHKTLFSYVDKNTKELYISFFQDALAVNPVTNESTLNLPSGKNGVSRATLSQIYNLFDVCVQYGSAEGLGMPAVEALCCGTTLMATDYSAMSNLVRMSDGFPIKVERMFLNSSTSSYRAYPSNEDLVDKLIKYLLLDDKSKKKHSEKARKVAEQYFDWDKIANDWSNYFENAKLTGNQGKWDSPENLLEMPQNIPNFELNSDFVNFLYRDTLKFKNKEHFLLQILQDLNYGLVVRDKVSINRQTLVKDVQQRIKEHNVLENIRCGKIRLRQEDYIEFGNK
jgi:glycosyltransferase involved in cell wall biosynthesis